MSTLSRELEFQLHEVLNVESFSRRPRYEGQTREDFDSILSAAERLAADFFAPHYAKGDANEPQFVDGNARTIPETGEAWRAFAAAGFLSAHWSADEGGIQLPEPIFRAAMAHFFTANAPTAGYPFLSIGAANLLRAFGTAELKSQYLSAMADGRCAGTMALTEPGQGSALGDIKTVAVPSDDGTYRIAGQKMFISGGDQDFTENIVHMVLARIKGSPSGVKGISLFLVPKFLPGSGKRNDVALAGLIHKMGWRNTTSTVLSFGENGGAVGWLLGEANRGLAHMFQLMNEARIGVGLIASSLAYRGFTESFEYARQRPQGRLPSSKDPLSPQVTIVGHADVRRLLLTQKAVAEGSLSLCLHASAWFEDEQTHPDPAVRASAGLLLDLITPVVKSWPSKHGCRSNEAAIQVLGGSGYTREYPLEQLYRDQRLNPIHEGAEAIHGIDLLGRKIGANNSGFQTFLSVVREETGQVPSSLENLAARLQDVLCSLESVTSRVLRGLATDPDAALANATEYLDAFGRICIAWMWLKQAKVAAAAVAEFTSDDPRSNYYHGKLQAAQFFYEWELPAAVAQLELVGSANRTALEMREEWFIG
ncbi:acyl-CoA dehydrogenase [Caballeronia sp.]|uniref:acyl-CoA dehydrogenase n=1 Tax=Caballeronia sp. TaxID=1931223 RepID=UPI003C52D58B